MLVELVIIGIVSEIIVTVICLLVFKLVERVTKRKVNNEIKSNRRKIR